MVWIAIELAILIIVMLVLLEQLTALGEVITSNQDTINKNMIKIAKDFQNKKV